MIFYSYIQHSSLDIAYMLIQKSLGTFSKDSFWYTLLHSWDNRLYIGYSLLENYIMNNHRDKAHTSKTRHNNLEGMMEYIGSQKWRNQFGIQGKYPLYISGNILDKASIFFWSYLGT